MSYTSSNNVFDAVKGQLEQELSAYVDSFIIFDGALSVAIEQHFMTGQAGNTVVFIGMPGSSSPRLNGCGLPIHEDIQCDIYVVVNGKGKSRYTSDRERLWDISDRIVHNVFECAARAQDFKDAVTGVRFVARTRADTNELAMAHRIEFLLNPVR